MRSIHDTVNQENSSRQLHSGENQNFLAFFYLAVLVEGSVGMSHLCSINVFKVFEHLEKCVEGQHRVYEDTHDAESRLNYLTKRGKFHTVFHLNSYAKSYDEHRLDHGDNPGVPKNALGQSFSDFVYSLRASLKEQENSPDHYQKQLEDYDQSECA